MIGWAMVHLAHSAKPALDFGEQLKRAYTSGGRDEWEYLVVKMIKVL